MATDDRGPSLWARRLGYGGLIPFLGLTAALWVAQPGDRPFASAALLGYGATIALWLTLTASSSCLAAAVALQR